MAGVTLLHYIVRARLAQEKDHNFDEPLPLPIPEPADMEAASTINFENLSAELDRLKNELEGKRDHLCIIGCINLLLFFQQHDISALSYSYIHLSKIFEGLLAKYLIQ